MSAYASINPSQTFSSCSKTQWNSFYQAYQPKCIDNTPNPANIWTLGTCGDGIVTGNEACDCGPSGKNKTVCPSDPCCNPVTCQLMSGALCSAAQPCCTSACKPVPRTDGRICRPSRDSECDTAEQCDGSNGDCPIDLVRSSGTRCDDHQFNTGSGYCFNGECHTADKACKVLASLKGYPVIGWKSCEPNDSSSNFCTAAYCSNSSTNCNAPFGSSPAKDGTPCASFNQCKNGRCVSSSDLDISGSYPQTPATPETNFIGPIQYNMTTILAISIVGGTIGLFALAACHRWKKRRDQIAQHRRTNRPPASIALAPPNIPLSEFARSAYAASGVNIQAAPPNAAPIRPSAANNRGSAYLGTIALPDGVDTNRIAGNEGGRPSSVDDIIITENVPSEPSRATVGVFEEYVTSKGVPYWFNALTGQTSWSDPSKGPINPNRPADI